MKFSCTYLYEINLVVLQIRSVGNTLIVPVNQVIPHPGCTNISDNLVYRYEFLSLFYCGKWWCILLKRPSVHSLEIRNRCRKFLFRVNLEGILSVMKTSYGSGSQFLPFCQLFTVTKFISIVSHSDKRRYIQLYPD